MDGKKTSEDTFASLRNNLGLTKSTQGTSQPSTTIRRGQQEPSEQFKANVFRKFDLNMFMPENEYLPKGNTGFVSGTKEPKSPINFESVDVLVVGNETSV
jgi:hypothetical protein